MLLINFELFRHGMLFACLK